MTSPMSRFEQLDTLTADEKQELVAIVRKEREARYDVIKQAISDYCVTHENGIMSVGEFFGYYQFSWVRMNRKTPRLTRKDVIERLKELGFGVTMTEYFRTQIILGLTRKDLVRSLDPRKEQVQRELR